MASNLQGIALYAIRNQSQPPRTLADDKRTFEIVLPDGAELDSAQAKGPGGQPIAIEASPTSQKNHYAFNYPLRPGETQFQVSYHMPYSGEASFSPKPLADVQHFVVMTPKGMTFTPKNPQQFQSMPDDSGAQQSWWRPTSSRGRTSASASRARASSRLKASRLAGRRLTRAAEQWADRKRPRTTIVPAADWARRSTRPIRCTSTARSFWECSRWCW